VYTGPFLFGSFPLFTPAVGYIGLLIFFSLLKTSSRSSLDGSFPTLRFQLGYVSFFFLGVLLPLSDIHSSFNVRKCVIHDPVSSFSSRCLIFFSLPCSACLSPFGHVFFLSAAFSFFLPLSLLFVCSSFY